MRIVLQTDAFSFRRQRLRQRGGGFRKVAWGWGGWEADRCLGRLLLVVRESGTSTVAKPVVFSPFPPPPRIDKGGWWDIGQGYRPLQGSVGNPVPYALARQLTSPVLLSVLPALLPVGRHVPESNCVRLSSQRFVTAPREDGSPKSRAGLLGQQKGQPHPCAPGTDESLQPWPWTPGREVPVSAGTEQTRFSRSDSMPTENEKGFFIFLGGG